MADHPLTETIRCGFNCVISDSACIGHGVTIGSNVVIEDGTVIEDDVQIDHGAIIRAGVQIGARTQIGANSVVGQRPSKGKSSTLQIDDSIPPLTIGRDCIIGIGVVLYAGTEIKDGCYVADGAQIRENTQIGESVIVGRAATVENNCIVGRETRLQTGSYITAHSVLEENVFIAPMVATTNDNYVGRTAERFKHRRGVTVRKGGRIGGAAVILPGKTIGQEALVAAGSVVTHDVPAFSVAMGIPSRVVRKVPDEQVLFKEEKR